MVTPLLLTTWLWPWLHPTHNGLARYCDNGSAQRKNENAEPSTRLPEHWGGKEDAAEAAWGQCAG